MKTMLAVVEFRPARKGGVMARVGGRVAFPDRGAWSRRRFPPPRVGDRWLVKVSGENSRKTVYFLTPIKREFSFVRAVLARAARA